MIDAFEQKHGPVEDRSIFDGEIIVPPHLRNMSLTSLRANRLHGSLFGSLSRSRTFLNITQNARHTFHGSVPDLNRNPFTFGNNNINIHNNSNGNNSVDDDHSRRLSSASTYTKITLNSSTTLTLTEDEHSSLSNGNFSSEYSNDTKNTFSMDSFDESQYTSINSKSDDGYKSNSIRSLNDIQLRDATDDRSIMYSHSLGRPMRAVLRPNIYTTKPSEFKNSRSQSMDAYNAEGYMTLIKTNASHTNGRASSSRAMSPLCTITSMHDISSVDSSVPAEMPPTSTSTFQRKQPPQVPSRSSQTTAGFTAGGELELNNFTKFKLPRVSLNHSTVTNPQQ